MTSLEGIQVAKRLRVLFASGNRLKAIEPCLQALAGTLQELHLERNLISGVEGVSSLRTLRVLNVEENRIESLQGFMETPFSETNQKATEPEGGAPSDMPVRGVGSSLIELRIARQRLPEGIPLDLFGLPPTLHFLDVSGCGLTELAPIGAAHHLIRLVAQHNRASAVEDAAALVSGLHRLSSLDLRGNPVSKQRHYRNALYTFSTYELGEQPHVTSVRCPMLILILIPILAPIPNRCTIPLSVSFVTQCRRGARRPPYPAPAET